MEIKFWNHWKKDKYIIIILLFALFACIYTIASADSYQNECNNHWSEQYEDLKYRYNIGNQESYGINFTKDFNYLELITGDVDE